MSTKPMKIRDSVFLAGLCLSVVVLLPLLAVLAFVARAGLFAGALLAVLVGVVAYAISPRFREWLRFEVEPALTYNGLRLDTGVALDAHHGWARFDDGEATVGADDLLQAVLGPVERVDLPDLGTRVHRGEPLFRLRHGFREVAVASPVTGRVVHTNAELLDSPHLVNRHPFGEGWAVRLEGDDTRHDRQALLHGAKARGWFRGEVDRLLTDLLPDSAGAVPALPDGGELVADLHRSIDDATWSRLRTAFFVADGTPS
jgi:glycine cleavage system H protein